MQTKTLEEQLRARVKRTKNSILNKETRNFRNGHLSVPFIFFSSTSRLLRLCNKHKTDAIYVEK